MLDRLYVGCAFCIVAYELRRPAVLPAEILHVGMPWLLALAIGSLCDRQVDNTVRLRCNEEIPTRIFPGTAPLDGD